MVFEILLYNIKKILGANFNLNLEFYLRSWSWS